MASLWSYGGVDIYVFEDSGLKPDPRIDYIDPITRLETTYVHQAGRESYTRDLKGWCIENYDTFEALADGNGYTLISDQGSLGTWVILSIKGERVQDSRPTPVVRVTLELMEVD